MSGLLPLRSLHGPKKIDKIAGNIEEIKLLAIPRTAA